MRLNQLSQAIPALYESRVAVHLIGPPGCGKSSFSRQAVDTLSKLYNEEFGYVDVIVPTKDAPDIQGFLVPHKNEDGTLPAIIMAPQWEEKISKTLVSTDQGSYAALDPNEVQSLVRDVSKSMEEVSQRGQVPVLLTTPELRRHVRRLLARFLPGLSILSYNEISPDTRILAINR